MPIPDKLTEEQRAQIRLWIEAKGYSFFEERQRDEEERMLDWHRALPIKDRRRERGCWTATFRNWLRKSMEFEQQAQQELPIPKPAYRWSGWKD